MTLEWLVDRFFTPELGGNCGLALAVLSSAMSLQRRSLHLLVCFRVIVIPKILASFRKALVPCVKNYRAHRLELLC